MSGVAVDEDVLTLGRRRVAAAFDRFDRVAVSFSGGKDSTVVLNLAYEEAQRRGQTLDVFFWDEEAIQPETVAYVDRVRQLEGIRLRWLCWPIEHRNACSRRYPNWYPWAPEDREIWTREPPACADLDVPAAAARRPYRELNEFLYPRSRGEMVGILLGLRADESLRRRAAVSMRVEDNWVSVLAEAPWISSCKPIYDWRTADVWTAPKLLGWDYNRAYDAMTAAGIPRTRQRICQPFGEEPLEGLHNWATCWPDLWERMVSRVPGARTAARYNRTSLFGYGRIEDPVDGDWRAAIEREIGKWPHEEQRSTIRKSIDAQVEQHRRATGGSPIPDRDPHPVTGLSMVSLVAMARRGDLKGRRAGSRYSRARGE